MSAYIAHITHSHKFKITLPSSLGARLAPPRLPRIGYNHDMQV